METLTADERRALRARAHHLRPVVAVGAQGLTPAVLHEIDVALKAHELVKIRVFSDVRNERDALLTRICGELDCAPVQHLGKLLIVWRRNPDLHAKASHPAEPHRRVPPKRRMQSSPEAPRGDRSSPSRIAPPSGAPRAPSRRRRGEVSAETYSSDQSRRRRRAH